MRDKDDGCPVVIVDDDPGFVTRLLEMFEADGRWLVHPIDDGRVEDAVDEARSLLLNLDGIGACTVLVLDLHYDAGRGASRTAGLREILTRLCVDLKEPPCTHLLIKSRFIETNHESSKQDVSAVLDEFNIPKDNRLPDNPDLILRRANELAFGA